MRVTGRHGQGARDPRRARPNNVASALPDLFHSEAERLPIHDRKGLTWCIPVIRRPLPAIV
ncbi:MAG: hypothetical protein ABIQ65_08455 [Thermoanaerobaculia bacterium]